MILKTIILLILTFSLVNSTSYKGKKPDCAKITCGLDCQGSCGWSSYYNKCKYGFTTSKHELNKGPGCKTKSNDDSKDGSDDESEDGSEDKSEDGTQETPEDTTVNSTVHTSTTTISLSTTTPTYTASAQPVVTTIQPLLFPIVLFNSTLATTPPPSIISKVVPIISAINGVIIFINY